ncbi:phospholipase [Psychrobacillus vulpis]|uniref:Phospholipase n=1 Tax=Psychrobacillus vulpis TaxID=2325572 RepID=A0A544TPJ8_9BACI|nr:phospholipase [Psychrobacillus vulpis]TQR19387.1 phospholipase [Psychrobacillus vulpis]
MSRRRGGKFRFCVFPGYNYCGPGCSGPGAPINDVDAACKAHDECYSKRGNLCECDREFLRRLRPQINPYTQQGRHARLIYNYMRLQTNFTCNSFKIR